MKIEHQIMPWGFDYIDVDNYGNKIVLTGLTKKFTPPTRTKFTIGRWHIKQK